MRLGFVGLGNYASLHLKAVERSDELTLAAAFDVNEETLRRVADRFGARKAAGIEDLAADPEVEGVVIATPNNLHFDQFQACASRGKHVFVNVPATTSFEEAREMIAIARRNGIVYMVGHNLRRNRAIVRIRELLATDAIGELHLLEATVAHPASYQLSSGSWRLSKSVCPLLPFAQYAIVFMDLIPLLMGPPEKVSAMMTKIDGAGDVADIGSFICSFPDGRQAYVGTSYISHDTYEMTVFGRNGKIKWDKVDANSLTVFDSDGIVRTEYEAIHEQLEELTEFAQCAMNGKEPSVGGIDAYNVAEFFRCIETSLRTGCAEQFRRFENRELVSGIDGAT